jgi:hypothetical protein
MTTQLRLVQGRSGLMTRMWLVLGRSGATIYITEVRLEQVRAKDLTTEVRLGPVRAHTTQLKFG